MTDTADVSIRRQRWLENYGRCQRRKIETGFATRWEMLALDTLLVVPWITLLAGFWIGELALYLVLGECFVGFPILIGLSKGMETLRDEKAFRLRCESNSSGEIHSDRT